MNDMINTLKRIVLLDEKTFQSFLASEKLMKRGIFILLACFLVAAFPSAAGQLVDNVTPFTQEKAETFQEEFMQGFEQALQFMPQDEGTQFFIDQFKENLAYGTSFAVAIDALPRPLPKAIGGFLQTLGTWFSAPFAHLGAWMGYAIWVLLFAKLLGGLGDTRRFLGLTALYAVPNLLGFFSFIPFLGGLIAFAGAVWGWVVFTKAVEQSQEFTTGKAILVAVLPVVVLILLVALVTILSVVSIFSSVQQ